MFKSMLLKLAKGLLKGILDEVIETVVKEVKQEVAEFSELTEKEKAVASMVLDLAAARAQHLIEEKVQ